MPRPNRVVVEGGIYHVYNRVARGEAVFEDAGASTRFVDLFREVVERDGLIVLAWVLMSNHFHIAVRTGPISLDRPMGSLQQRFTRYHNSRNGFHGPLWQERYRAKPVEDQQYFDLLLAYIHLNPVVVGMVEDPGEYLWSGHREIVGLVKEPITDVDEVLQLFGSTRRAARAAYVRALKVAAAEEWIGEQPGRIPWWRTGRPPETDNGDPESALGGRREGPGPLDRPRITAEDFVDAGAEWMDESLDDLRGRGKKEGVVRARELIATLGVERYGLRVKDIAEVFGKPAGTATAWIMRGSRRRQVDEAFQERFELLDTFMVSRGVGRREK